MMEYHQIANLFPMMNHDELAMLCNDMREHGYDKTAPIVIYQGKILDGRNRQLAADTVGVVPEYVVFDNGDPLTFVIRHNLKRRHLNETQLAIVASKLANMRQGGDRPSEHDSNFHSATWRNGNISQSEAAAKLNVSPRTIQRVTAIEREAPELVARMERGEMTANEAIKIIRKDKRAADIAEQVKEIEINLNQPPTGNFDVIVIDPPWPYGTEYDPDTRRAANPYPEMSLENIQAIQLPAAADCILWLWTTHKFMRHSFSLLDGWGFRDVSILTWEKDRMGLGAWLRSQSEFCIMAVKGKPKVNLTNQTTVIHGPLREHSRKPDEFYTMVDCLCVGYKIDWFSRQTRKGWAQFGNDTRRFE